MVSFVSAAYRINANTTGHTTPALGTSSADISQSVFPSAVQAITATTPDTITATSGSTAFTFTGTTLNSGAVGKAVYVQVSSVWIQLGVIATITTGAGTFTQNSPNTVATLPFYTLTKSVINPSDSFYLRFTSVITSPTTCQVPDIALCTTVGNQLNTTYVNWKLASAIGTPDLGVSSPTTISCLATYKGPTPSALGDLTVLPLYTWWKIDPIDASSSALYQATHYYLSIAASLPEKVLTLGSGGGGSGS
jgi:hypothetical protein